MYRNSIRLMFISVALLVFGAIAGTLCLRGVEGAAHTLSQQTTADGVWVEIDRTNMRQAAVEGAGPISYRLLRLNRDALSSVLNRAPKEMAEKPISGDTILILPLPAGGYERFRIEESPVLAPELAAELPQVRSFRGRGILDSAMWLRFDLTPHGLHALVTSNKETVTIHPANAEGDGLYVVYSAENYRAVIEEFSCRVIEQVQAEDKVAGKRKRAGEMRTVSQESIGQTLRTYRIAVSTTQEYSNSPALGGGTVAGTVASINTWLNGVNLIFERELSIRFVLVANNANAIYSAEPDPFTNGDTANMVNQAGNVFSTQIGNGNYDVGHVLGTGGGGMAALNVVCSSGVKGLGVSLINQGGPAGNIGDLGVLLHELGHQFGAEHSFNASCGGSRSPAAAYESGSGLTIMSYAGMCSPDMLANSRSLHFHSGSIAAINSYINDSHGGSCPVLTEMENATPLVDAGPDYTIPRSTPFALSAAANDPDPGDAGNLTYSWEQIDAGGTSYLSPPYTDAADPAATTRPIFRPFKPTTSPSRTFPSLTYILSSANIPPATATGVQTAENLPSIGRQLNFNCVVRDGRGGTTVDSVRLTVADNAGPFQITQPNSGETWVAGNVQTITWNVNGTNLAPVNCLQARITLSIDGGQSFPIVLEANTQNDGIEEVTIPASLATTTARIKVEAAGNIFFDISDVNFAIVPPNSCPAVTGLIPSIGHPGADVTLTGINLSGVTSVRFGGNVPANFTVTGSTQLVTTVPGGAVSGAIKVSKPNCTDSYSDVFTVRTSPPVVLAVDDGSFEAAYGGVIAVNRLTPSVYPATLNSVSIFFASWSGVTTGAGFDLLVGANPDGDANIDNTIFQETETAVKSLDQFSVYSVASVTITSGDFVVGFRYAPASGVFPVVVDQSPPSRARSYGSGDGVTFTLQDSYGPYFVGNSGIRANVYQGVWTSSCESSISPASASFSLSSGSGTIRVVDETGCGWTAVSNAPWIVVAGPAVGEGNADVTYLVEVNTGQTRSGTITVAGQAFTVTQGGGLQYYPLAHPIRLLDTRLGTVACDTPGAPLAGGASRTEIARGTCDGVTIPANAKAIVGNATVVNFLSDPGFITLYPSDAARPTVSNLNYDSNHIVPNAFTVGLGSDGAFNIWAHTTTHFIVDITGYYAPPDVGGLYYHPLPHPVRLLDTRAGEVACDTPGAPLTGGASRSEVARGTCGGFTIPAAAQAVVGNATVVNFLSDPGFITLYPSGATRPTVSNLNYNSNHIVPNAFTVALGSDGAFNIWAHTTTHFVVDIAGYFSSEAVDVNGAGLLYYPLAHPIRLLDTRLGTVACDTPGAPLTGNASRLEQARVSCDGVTIPAAAQAVIGNATVVNFLSGPGFITLYPSGSTRPLASNLNYRANQIVPNAFTIGLGSDGAFNIFSPSSTHFIVDLTGFYAP